jgi:hypothetical protein
MSALSKTKTGIPRDILGDVVFLFGAGASFGADLGQVSPERPPLMRDVYDRTGSALSITVGAFQREGQGRARIPKRF